MWFTFNVLTPLTKLAIIVIGLCMIWLLTSAWLHHK